MPQDIKDLFDITNENIIDYEDVYNSYLEKLTFLIDEDFNFEKLFKLLNGFKFIHSIFYPEYENINIDTKEIFEKQIKGEEYMLAVSCYAILKIDEIKNSKSIDLMSSIEENVKRDYWAPPKIPFYFFYYIAYLKLFILKNSFLLI